MNDLEQRVAAGAALLDRERPGWWEEVDTEKLEMSSECRCVLGQIFGSYIKGTGVLEWDDEAFVREAIAHGFDIDLDRESYDDLDRLWLAAIAERRARAKSVGPTAEEWAGQR